MKIKYLSTVLGELIFRQVEW